MPIYLGDIPGGSLFATASVVASVASNGAAASANLGWRAPQAAIITGAWWQPGATSQATTTSATASYRRLTLVNGGQAVAGTTVLGSLNLTVSLTSLTTRAFTLASNPTVAAGDNLIFSHVTVGGDDSETTVLRAGTLFVNYRPISPA